MVPVNDHNDNHHTRNDNDHYTTIGEKVPDQTEHQTYLTRVGKGKDGEKMKADDATWNNDPWAMEKAEMLETMEQTKNEKQTM